VLPEHSVEYATNVVLEVPPKDTATGDGSKMIQDIFIVANVTKNNCFMLCFTLSL
jgi:hypothetical protein